LSLEAKRLADAIKNIPPSEYGRGLVICLVKFAMHFMDPTVLKTSLSNSRESSRLIESWASRASDHLLEIEVPERLKGSELERKVNELKDLGIGIGHGHLNKLWTWDDFRRLMKLTFEIALLIDMELGLNPDEGEVQ